MTTYDVFLSHASADKPAVEALARRLRKDGFEPVLDKWHLVPGEPWQEALEETLASSRMCAVFVGREFGPWEMGAALAQRVRKVECRVIPVLLAGALEPADRDPPRFLSRLTWVDLRGGWDDKSYQRFVSGIRGSTAPLQPAVPSASPLMDEPPWWRKPAIVVPAVVTGRGARPQATASAPQTTGCTALCGAGYHRSNTMWSRFALLPWTDIPVPGVLVWRN